MKRVTSHLKRLNLTITADPQTDLSEMIKRADAARFIFAAVFQTGFLGLNTPSASGVCAYDEGGTFIFPFRNYPVQIITSLSEEGSLSWFLNLDENNNLGMIMALQRHWENGDDDVFENPMLAPTIDNKEGLSIGKLYVIPLPAPWCRLFPPRRGWAILNTNFPRALERWREIQLPGEVIPVYT